MNNKLKQLKQAFTQFLKQFPDLFMAFKNTVTFKIHRRQEYMQNIESNYKEVMKQKEQQNNQRQSEIRIIQQIQTQKSFSDLSCASPIPQSSSPLVRKQSFQQILLRQLSQSVVHGNGESPSITSFDQSSRLNTIDRKNLLSYCAPSNRITSSNISLIDFDSLNSNSNNNNQQQSFKFKLIQNSSQDSITKQVLSTLHEVEQHQIDEEDEQPKRQYQPQLKLIKLVRTQNNILLPQQLDRQFSLKSTEFGECNSSKIKSNSQSPTQIQKLKLMQEIQQDDNKSLMTTSHQQTENKFIRNSGHSKTLSCISQISQSDLQLSQLNIPTFQRKIDYPKSKSQIFNPHQNQQPKQQNLQFFTQTNQKPNDVIRQENIEELVDLQEFLDVQYFETKYNPEKLEELLKAVDELKSKQKSNKNVIENQLEFLYNQNSKEMGIRIDQIKQKIHNSYRLDLSHQNDHYTKNRQNIYSNSPTKSVDKVAQISKHYFKKQDGYDKIIRNNIVQTSPSNNNKINTSQLEIIPQIKRKLKSEESKHKENELKQTKQDNLLKSSSLESKYTNQNEKNTLDTANSNNNLDNSSQNQHILISQIENPDKIRTSKAGNESQNELIHKPNIIVNSIDSIQNNKIDKLILANSISLRSTPSVQSPSKQSPITQITHLPLKLTKQQMKLSQSPLKQKEQQQQQQSPSKNNQTLFNFNIVKYPSTKSASVSSTELISNEHQPKSPTKISNLNSLNLINQFTIEKNNNQQLQNLSKSAIQSQLITPANSSRRNLTSIGISRQQQKTFVIKQQNNASSSKSISHSPIKLQQLNVLQNEGSQDSPITLPQEDQKYSQSFFLKHRKTQSQLIFDVVPSHQISHLPTSAKSNSFSQKFHHTPSDPKSKSNYIQQQKEKHAKHSSMYNLTELLNNNNNTNPLISSELVHTQHNLTALPSPTTKSSYRQYLNRKLNSVVGDSQLHNKSNSTIQLNLTNNNNINISTNLETNNPLSHSHPLQQQQLHTNPNEQKEVVNFSNNYNNQSNANQIQFHPNIKQGLRKTMQIQNGSTINSSLNLKSFLDQVSTNSPLFSNSPQTKKIQTKQS